MVIQLNLSTINLRGYKDPCNWCARAQANIRRVPPPPYVGSFIQFGADVFFLLSRLLDFGEDIYLRHDKWGKLLTRFSLPDSPSTLAYNTDRTSYFIFSARKTPTDFCKLHQTSIIHHVNRGNPGADEKCK